MGWDGMGWDGMGWGERITYNLIVGYPRISNLVATAKQINVSQSFAVYMRFHTLLNSAIDLSNIILSLNLCCKLFIRGC